MSLLQCCDLLIDHFKSSPVRTTNDLERLPVQRAADLERCLEEANLLREKVDTKLKLVFVGEVKSGKSTLINRLVGRKVSPTNVLEVTSTIFEIHYSDIDGAEIYYTTGAKKIVSIDCVS